MKIRVIDLICAFILIVLSVVITSVHLSDSYAKKDPCVDTVYTYHVLKTEVASDGTFKFEIRVQNLDEIKHLGFSTSTPKEIIERVKPGKTFKLCYVVF